MLSPSASELAQPEPYMGFAPHRPTRPDRSLDVLCFATQGPEHGEQRRISFLLDPLRPRVLGFDRAHKRKMPLAILRSVRRRRPDVIVIEGTGLGGGLGVMSARSLAGVPYVVSSGDAVAPFLRTLHPPVWPAAVAYERALYRACAGFIGWSPYLAGRALELGAPRAMTAAHFSPSQPRPGARAAVREALGIPADAIVVGIAGSLNMNPRIGYSYGVDLVRALRLTDRPDLRVLIVGDGTGVPTLEQLAGDDLGRRVLLPGRCPQDQVPDYLAAMDVAALSQSTDLVGAMRYTTKLPEYVAAGLPLVIGETPAAYDLDTGWLWRLPGDAPWEQQHVEALADLMQHVSRAEIEERRARVPRDLDLFNAELQQQRVCDFVREVTARAAPKPSTVP